MLNLLPALSRTCEGVSRRDFLRVGALAGLGVSLPMALASKAAAKDGVKSKDVNCILIWTLGGTSHHDTFDPKPDAPASVRGEYSFIRTAVPGVQFTEVCPTMARELKAGDRLRMVGGVAELESIETDKTQVVHNLDVAEHRDFFVGTKGLLVHDFSFVQPVSEPFDRQANAAPAASR